MDKYKYQIGERVTTNNNDLIITERYKKAGKKGQSSQLCYKFQCKKCGWKNGEITERFLVQDRKCSCCANRTVVEGINDIPTTAPWMISFFPRGVEEAKKYTKSSGKRIYPRCPDCGDVKNKSITINNIYTKETIGCYCKDGVSFANKFGWYMLISIQDQLEYYEREYTPDWAKSYSYDFHFIKEGKLYVLEMNGGLGHGKKVYYNDSTMWYKCVERDLKKIELAFEHAHIYLDVDCTKSNFDYIKEQILDSDLNDILDLSKVDWQYVEAHVSSNLVKAVCEYRKNHPEMTTTQIGQVFQLHRQTIAKYLTTGNRLGWCIYDAKSESLKINQQNGNKHKTKPVKAFLPTQEEITFLSANEAAQKISIILETNYAPAGIRKACNKEHHNYKQCRFYYSEEKENS